MAEDSLVGQIGNELERVFRYLLPGITVIGFACLSHPSWFCRVHLDSSQHLVLLAAIALSVGCSWYVIHRYSLHQFADWIFYWSEQGRYRGYPSWLAKHVTDSARSKKNYGAARHNIGLRSAHVIFMYITGEAGLLFVVAPEKGNIVFEHKVWIWTCSGAIICAALW